MAPLDPQHMFRKLKIDTSSSSSPISSTTNSPSLQYRSRSAERSTRSNDWHLPWSCDPAVEHQRQPDDFFNRAAAPPKSDTTSDIWACAPTGPRLGSKYTADGGASVPTTTIPESAASDYNESSLPSNDIRERQPSVSFNPKVVLDSGHEKSLGERLSKANKWNPPARPRGRSLLQEISHQHTPVSPSARARTSSERQRYNGAAGEPIGRAARSARLVEIQAPPLHSSTGDSVTSPNVEDSIASLTSESTSSPLIEEAATPPETPVDFTLSPLSASSFLGQATSLNSHEESWPVPARRTSVTRSKSYTIDRTRSQRARRIPSRCSSTSLSPASAFLSSWGAVAAAAAATEPDDEGQEIGNYVLGKQIGFGGFSIVREARTIEDSTEVRRAVKIVRKHINGKPDRENEQVQSEFEHEVSIWRFLDHANVLPLLAVYDTPFATFCFTQLHDQGSLFDLVRANRKGLPLPLVKRYAFQLASAIRYLHEDARIVHRDIKLENCLLDMSDETAAAAGGNLLLCDFGMAEYIPGGTDDDDDTSSSSQSDGSEEGFQELTGERPAPKNIGPSDTSTAIVGSLEYASPELLKSTGPLFSKPSDMWAFGVVIYALLVGELPFQHTFQPKVPMMILNGDWNREALGNVQAEPAGRDAAQLVKGCLEMDPILRWNVGHVLHCIWLEDCNEVYESELSGGWEL
ncbi:MAG: hypothetical protein M4579_005760 [Chaenotheca gracillima]|nr:MAG: hypothetical protein M4579_005760 [Chaenotheca gracillima]